MEELNPYLIRIRQIIEKQKEIIPTCTISDPLAQTGLNNVDCPICNNKGYILRTDEDGITWARDCTCMKKRISIRRIDDAGLRDLVQKYTFNNYNADDPVTAKIKKKAWEFTLTDAPCFIIMGKSGSGKTHICTAICSQLIEDGWKTKYFLWRTDAAILKSMVNEGERYQQEINKLRNVPVLYIDDLFKGSVSEADVNLAFTILNERYNSSNKKTIISTERTVNELVKIDEAIAGRIVEMARGYVAQAPKKNWRMEE